MGSSEKRGARVAEREDSRASQTERLEEANSKYEKIVKLTLSVFTG